MTAITNQTPPTPNKNDQKIVSWLSILLFLLGVGALLFSWYWSTSNQPPEVEAITREGVIAQIQDLNRLQTVGFSVDTVITSERQGNWYNLWQDEQKGLFVAHGRVVAGIDLNRLTADQVQVSAIYEDPNDPKSAILNHKINITIPRAEVFDVYLDNIEVYDLQTGLFGLLKTDPQIFEKAQQVGKLQVLQTACQGDVLKLATDNAQKQVEGLFHLTGFEVNVTVQAPKPCKINS